MIKYITAAGERELSKNEFKSLILKRKELKKKEQNKKIEQDHYKK